MNTPIVSFNNDRLTTILKKFYDKKLNIASYDDYTEKVRDEKKNLDIQKIINQTKTELKNLVDTIQKEIKTLVTELSNLMYPNISQKMSVTGQKTYGAIEFRNALEIYKARPKNIHEIIKAAIELERFDFVFFTLDFYMKDPGLPFEDKSKIQTIFNELATQTGFKDMQEKKTLLERDLIEVDDHLKLITESPEGFEAQVMTTIKVVRAMNEAGQLEGETLLL